MVNKIHHKNKFNSGKDKHNSWLVFGISIAVLLVLVLTFYSPMREAVVGKALGDTCVDSDVDATHLDGKNYDVYGLVTLSDGSKKSDFCYISPNMLREWYCDGVEAKSEQKDCNILGKVCQDGACIGQNTDNDQDGVFDVLEPIACRNTPTSKSVYPTGENAGCMEGDVNTDGCVNINDIFIIGPNVDLTCTTSAGKTLSQGDMNGDGCVNIGDILKIGPNVNLDCTLS